MTEDGISECLLSFTTSFNLGDSAFYDSISTSNEGWWSDKIDKYYTVSKNWKSSFNKIIEHEISVYEKDRKISDLIAQSELIKKEIELLSKTV